MWISLLAPNPSSELSDQKKRKKILTFSNSEILSIMHRSSTIKHHLVIFIGRATKLLSPQCAIARSILRASADNFPPHDFTAENPALPCKNSRADLGIFRSPNKKKLGQYGLTYS